MTPDSKRLRRPRKLFKIFNNVKATGRTLASAFLKNRIEMVQ